ncbi:4'-phosphopantetheinyl transferase family protein [Jatrophihabitans sp. DSM 45814]
MTTLRETVRAGIAVYIAQPVANPFLLSLLDEAERERYYQLLHERDRARFAAAHGLTRLALSRTVGRPPAELAIEARCLSCGGPHGKPMLARPADTIADQAANCRVHFSLSHAADLVSVAITELGPIGIDIEAADGLALPDEAAGANGIADVALTASERAAEYYENRSLSERDLLRYWVRKEALLKATGHGLAVAPSLIEVSGPDEPPRLVRWNAPDAPLSPPFLADLALGPDYLGCVAVLTGRPRATLEIITRRVDEWLTGTGV